MDTGEVQQNQYPSGAMLKQLAQGATQEHLSLASYSLSDKHHISLSAIGKNAYK